MVDQTFFIIMKLVFLKTVDEIKIQLTDIDVDN